MGIWRGKISVLRGLTATDTIQLQSVIEWEGDAGHVAQTSRWFTHDVRRKKISGRLAEMLKH